HSGRNAAYYVIERQEPPAKSWSSWNHADRILDTGLYANTTYHYHVCAVDPANNSTCSPWVAVTTMPPASSGSSYSIPIVARQELAPDHVSISWSSTTRYSSFNVRWFVKGAPANQAGQVNRPGGTSGSYVVGPLRPGQTYVILVEGCNWGPLGSSCSQW